MHVTWVHDAHTAHVPEFFSGYHLIDNIKTVPSFPLTGHNIKNPENTIRIITIILLYLQSVIPMLSSGCSFKSLLHEWIRTYWKLVAACGSHCRAQIEYDI